MEWAGGCSPSLRHIARRQGDLASAGVAQGVVVLEPHDSGCRVGFEHHLQRPAPVQLCELYSVQLLQQVHVATLCKGQPSAGQRGYAQPPMGQHLLGPGLLEGRLQMNAKEAQPSRARLWLQELPYLLLKLGLGLEPGRIWADIGLRVGFKTGNRIVVLTGHVLA